MFWAITERPGPRPAKEENDLVEQTPHRTFLLGVGCQKGGTTWLHDYLQRSEQTDLGFMKEYHVFDVLDLDIAKPLRKRVLGEGRRALAAFAEDGEPKKGAKARIRHANALRRLQFHLDPESYFDYFQHLLLRDPGIRLTADITPSYAGLSAGRLAFIREGFLRRGIAVRAIFLMRDPVERIWSAIRMNYRRHREQDPDGDYLKMSEEERLLRTYGKPQQAVRTRYDKTIGALERVFAPGEIHYEFYERLFTEEAVARICAFLEIDTIPADFGRRVNASPKSLDISDSTLRRIAGHYGKVYDAVEERFGAGTVRDLWAGARRRAS